MHWLCEFETCLCISIPFWYDKKVVYFIFIFVIDCWISIWNFICTGSILNTLFINISYAPPGSIVLHFTLRMSSISIAGIPNNARPLPGTTKNLHNLSPFLYLIAILHIPNYIILYLLYVHNITLLSLCFANSSFFALGYNILNISRDIKFPSLPLST